MFAHHCALLSARSCKNKNNVQEGARSHILPARSCKTKKCVRLICKITQDQAMSMLCMRDYLAYVQDRVGSCRFLHIFSVWEDR